MRKRRTDFLNDYVANQYPIEKFKELIFITLDIVENFLLTLECGYNYNSSSIASYGKNMVLLKEILILKLRAL